MSHQVDHLELALTDGDPVAVPYRPVGGDGDLLGVVRSCDRLGAGRLHDRRQPSPVVGVAVGGDHAGQPVGADQLEQPVRVVGRVHEQLLVGAPAAQQVGVVVPLTAHRQLRDHQVGQLADLGGSTGPDVPVVGHRSPLSSMARFGASSCGGRDVVGPVEAVADLTAPDGVIGTGRG